MKEFKVLLVYVNSPMDNLIPLNISYLTACLKKEGISVRLFDTTFYRTSDKSSDEARVEMLQVRPFDLAKYGIDYKTSDVFGDLRKLVAEYAPDLIGFSVVESTYKLAVRLLDSIGDIKGDSKVIFGGIFATFAFDKIIAYPLVDMVCCGEGEEAMVDICRAMSGKKNLRKVDNLIIKENGKIFHSGHSPLMDLNRLPCLDFSLFEKERFYKPMGGKVLKMLPVEFARGCPYRCTYCASPALSEMHKEEGNWFRQKDVNRIIYEIEFYLKRYNAEYFYFISDSFLSMPENSFNQFIDFYKSIRIPFWFNTGIQTISPYRLRKLEEANCNRISVGLESGSELIRKKLLKRAYSNDYFVEKFKILGDYNIAVSVNNIIGFPGETRAQIFETINLNRNINAESFGAYIFQPYYGTVLRDYCIKKGYITEDYLAGDVHLDSGLDMPNITKEDIRGLQKTFALYVKLPERYYDDIKIAEGSDKKAKDKFKELEKVYYEDGA